MEMTYHRNITGPLHSNIGNINQYYVFLGIEISWDASCWSMWPWSMDILKYWNWKGLVAFTNISKIRSNRTNEPLMCRMDYPNIGYSHGNPMICHGLPYLNGQRFGYNPFCANHLMYLVILQIRLDYVRLDQVPSGLTHPPFRLRVGAQTWAMTLLRGTRLRHWQSGVRIKPLVVPKKIDYII